MEWQTLLAVLSAFGLLLTAYNTRKQTESNVASQAVDAAGKSIQLRERDIRYLERKINKRDAYIAYVWKWIRDNHHGKRFPRSFENFRG